ncbi:pimeloyl-ACP methyl ester carboxylesterase [Natranaerovirga hydrolytica]|uniref:Pimeloyl-ACP methyl ester carboxylesterase n=1 Tax=Natranaerovirga hydrolytica TaxID=680378 RepID=A0A4R1MZM8_9FIRM|nr:alpha/beta hydrolase [Natranaerovirga hydrolytica]TCK98032.1 pimeloyl-ACP methyl ester carboxylesterase [Natranaerovirga hydrolytica]
MNYKIEGKENKTLVVFVNGAGISKWMWRYQKALCKKYKCIFFDLPGHGDNSHIDFISIDDVSLFLIDLIKNKSDDNKAVVIGLSIGAQIALNLLKSYNEHISKAVVISGLNKPMKIFNLLLKPMIEMSTPLIKNKSFSKIQFKQFSLPTDWFEDYYKDSLKVSKESLINITKENMSFNFDQIVGDIPTLILTGEREKRIMKKSAHKTASYIKESESYIIKGAGHGIPYEKPELFNNILVSFISNEKINVQKGVIVQQGY